ncbi:MAG: hypothetical protein MI751_18035 [Pseudomonadales bacterium]|uniref:hypothetical protein n=1 Tax=Alcanivorax profundi TaxID=2338368 RepID=UPI0032B18230|nr:hypothetical protein [Pseudomonadales bacterium]|tara:strand:+ start:1064 stop:1708 length:645 start_codon:yes stop_codon:yes gene_type:complete
MKQNWLEWLNWKDEKSCSWAISYCVKKQLPGTAIPNPATASSEELRRIIQNWPARKPENTPSSPGREELMKEEHRMRNAYAQWKKRRKASSHKNYTLWMSTNINKKLHKYAKEYHLSISATVQLLLEDFHGEIKRIEEEHKKKRREQQAAHEEQQNDLKDRIKQQEKTITDLRAKLNKPTKRASQSSAVTGTNIPIVKCRARLQKLYTPRDEDH